MTKTRIYFSMLLALVSVPFGCRGEDPLSPAQAIDAKGVGAIANQAATAANNPNAVSHEIAGDQIRTIWQSAAGDRVVIRVRQTQKRPTEKLLEQWRAADEVSVATWQACVHRVTTTFPSPEARHDACLEAVDRLERALRDDPTHLGMLRDLVTVYATLISYERDSPLGANICQRAARRLRQFSELAAPLSTSDSLLISRLRVWLYLVMRQYPLAAQQLASMSAGSDHDLLREALTRLGQDHFLELSSYDVSNAKVRVFRTMGVAPHPEMLWPELHFVVTPVGEPSPERVLSYSLSRRGSGQTVRYYLCLHTANQSRTLALLGPERPAVDEIDRQVRALLQRAVGDRVAAVKNVTSKKDTPP